MESSNCPSSLSHLSLMLPEVQAFDRHTSLPRKLPLQHLGRQEMPSGLNSFPAPPHNSLGGSPRPVGEGPSPEMPLTLSPSQGPRSLPQPGRDTQRCRHFGLDPVCDWVGCFSQEVRATLKKKLRYELITFCRLFFLFLINKLYFLSSFRLTKKLSRKFGELLYTPCPHTHTHTHSYTHTDRASPIIHIPPPDWCICYIQWTEIDIPSSPKVHSLHKVCSWCCIFYRFGKMHDIYPPK